MLEYRYSLAIGLINELSHLLPQNILEQFRKELNNGENSDGTDTRVPERSDGVDRDKRNTDSSL